MTTTAEMDTVNSVPLFPPEMIGVGVRAGVATEGVGAGFTTVKVGQQCEPITTHISDSVSYRNAASTISTHIKPIPIPLNGRISSKPSVVPSGQMLQQI